MEAALALWTATKEPAPAVTVLQSAVSPLATGSYAPVVLTAVRGLTRIGDAARPAADMLSEVPAVDRRLHYFGGWTAFDTDEKIRRAVDELLAATSSPC